MDVFCRIIRIFGLQKCRKETNRLLSPALQPKEHLTDSKNQQSSDETQASLGKMHKRKDPKPQGSLFLRPSAV